MNCRQVGALASSACAGAGASAGPSARRLGCQGGRGAGALPTAGLSSRKMAPVACGTTGAVRSLHQSAPSLAAGSWSESMRRTFRKAKRATQRQLGYEVSYDEELDEMNKPEGLVASQDTKAAKALLRRARKRYSKPINYIDAQGVVQRKETQHKYSTAAFKISNRKLKMLADQIGSGKPLDFAILQMQFSNKRAAKRIKSTLCLAKDHAIAKGLDSKRLVVAEAWVNKHRTLKRVEIKGRGRAGVRKHKYCRLHIILREGLLQSQKDEKKLRDVRRQAYSIGTGGVSPTNGPLRNQWKSPGWQW